MTLLVNLGNGSGTAGSAVTTANSGGAGSNAFDAVVDLSSTSVDWSSTVGSVWSGATKSVVASAAAGAGQAAYVEWTTSLVASGGTASQLNAGCGLYFTSLPTTADVAIIRGLLTTNQRWRVTLTSAGKIQFKGNANVQFGPTSTITLSTSTLYWIEVGAAGHATAGTGEVRIYNASGTLLETIGPVTGIDTGGNVNSIRYGIGASVSPTGSATTVYTSSHAASDAGWIGPLNASAPTVAIGPILGAVSDTGVTASYRIDTAGVNARLVVATDVDTLTGAVYSSTGTTDADGWVKLSVTGLTANTSYEVGIELSGVVQTSPGRGAVRTDPTPGTQASFSVAFGSCNYTEPTGPTFEAIRTKTGSYGKARRLIHMGDLWYPSPDDGYTTAAELQAQYDDTFTNDTVSPCTAEIPWTYAWDNHDWAGTDSNKNFTGAAVTAAAYRAYFPHYPLPASDGIGIWQTWVIGRVRFIQIDPRSQRDPRTDPNGPSKTLLGTEQKAWLKTQLSSSEPVKIICGNMYWRQDSSTGDRWGSYPDEWTEINDYIDSSVGHVYVIFGDRHALCADDGSSSGTRGTPQAGGAPFQQGTVALPGGETWSAGYYSGPGGTITAYGWLDIVDAGTTITINYSGITSNDDVTRVSMSTAFTVEHQAAAALAVTATLTAGAAATKPAAAALAVTAGLSAGATPSRPAAAALAVTATQSAGATGTRSGDAALAVTATLTAGLDKITMIPNTSGAIVYNGTWSTFSGLGSGWTDGSATSNNGSPANAYFDYTNTNCVRLQWWATTATTGRATGQVYLDGAPVATVNQNSTPARTTSPMWDSGPLTAGSHTIRVVNLGGSWLENDGIGYVAPSGVSQTASAALAVTATLAAGADRTAVAGAALAVTATLTAGAGADRPAGVALAVTAGLTAGALADRPATAALAVTATTTAGATRSAATGAALPVTATLNAGAVTDRPAAAALAVTATLTADATRTAVAAAALAVTATLTAGAVQTKPTAAALAVVATMAADATIGTAPKEAAAALAVVATLTTGAEQVKPGAVALAVTATLTATGQVGAPPQTASAALAVTAALVAGATASRPADTALLVTAALTAGATRQALPAAALPVVATLTAGSAGTSMQAAAALLVVATLTAAATTGTTRITYRPYTGITYRP